MVLMVLMVLFSFVYLASGFTLASDHTLVFRL